ncbi:DNA polymerase I [Saccharicrinis fermentans]|uniref:DNA polymerase I n=1 Tax=Saccharicrinis fermentans DSM 9555 = JCM 21142 TaxID=869213 RepID=W7Y1A3_9BACT|nr:DNA polymerase I [Saccharicrinis fermentans]GAF04695.1 DNA polymerase I [Saccharicrinis fermentans DSM 9555 = JCM 21142]
MEENKKLFLLDAYALIYRAYYAFIRAPRINSKKLNTSAIYGFTNSLLEVIQKEKPSHLAVAFDPAGPTFRHEMYKPYKAQREATPEDIKLAVPYIKRLLEALNIPILEVYGYEADDVIGTISHKADKAGFEVFMMTPDKDYAQLVTANVKMFKPRSKGGGMDILGIPEVQEKFAIEEPIQVIDILALMGDASDNIPGCPGIGEKGAKDIIAKYKSITGIYDHIDEFKGKRKENLINFKEQVELSYTLATIKLDVPIELNEKNLEISEPNPEKLMPLLEELEFKSMMPRFGLASAPAAMPAQGDLFGQPQVAETTAFSSSLKTIEDLPHQYYLVDNDQAYASLAAELSIQKEFCFDTETTSLNTGIAELVGISFSWKKGEAYYVPFPEEQQQAISLAQRFKKVLEDENIVKIGQNLKYDILVLRNYGIHVKGKIFDTMVAHHLAFPGQKNNMDFMAETYLGYTPVKIESLIGKKGKGQLNFRHVELNKAKEYAAEDADITLQLKEYLEPKIKEAGLDELFYQTEMPLVLVLAQMEATGVQLDVDELNQFATKLNVRITTLEKDIIEMAGMEFNVGSPKQVGEVLFEHMKIDAKAKKTKSGQFSTSEETLTKLKGKHNIIDKILEFRGLKKLLNTYVEALPQLVNPKTGKIHTTYNQAVVVTGRLNSTNPNLQNIPIRDEDGREIRKAFIPSNNDHVFLSADYSQVELRLMAHLSQDKQLVEAFNNGEDIHAATAAKIFKVSLDEVTSDMRRKAKTANFGIIYGISAFGLAERLTISRSEAKQLIDGYFENFPDVKAYMDKSIEIARENGYVETVFGRKRNLPDINSRNGVVRGMAERNAINAPIQGTAADIIKMAMVNIQAELDIRKLQSQMILQVHDELNFDVLKSELEEVKEIVKTKMENACKLSVPLSVDMGVGANWHEAH